MTIKNNALTLLQASSLDSWRGEIARGDRASSTTAGTGAATGR